MDIRALNHNLATAIVEGDFEWVLSLLRQGADPNGRTEDGSTPFLLAVMHGYTGEAAFLLKAGADPDSLFGDGRYPLSIAVGQNNRDMVTLLAKQGADIFRRPEGTHSYLDEAYQRRRYRAATVLQSYGLSLPHSHLAATDAEARQWLSWTAPAICASEDGDLATLKVCLEQGVDLTTEEGGQLLITASRRGDLEMVRLLIRSGADPNRAFPIMTALTMAALHAQSAVLEEFLGSGAEVNQGKEYGETPLMAAVRSRKEDKRVAVEILIAAGAEINPITRYGGTPLMNAASRGDIKTVQYLLQMGADKSRRDQFGRRALDKLPNNATPFLRQLLSSEDT